MNNSFEQLFKKINPNKELPSKNLNDHPAYFKKQPKSNPYSKIKTTLNSSHSKYPPDPYQYSVISNGSVEKNLNKPNASKSNHKKSNKRQDTTNKKNRQSSLLRKCPTLQLTKKQKEIRQAIQYRYEKSKMKTYKFCYGHGKFDQNQDSKARQIIDEQEQERFIQLYGYLSELKMVNLYEYSLFKQQMIAPQKEKEKQRQKQTHNNNKIIVIKNPKKKRQNSDTIISFNNGKDDELKWSKNINTKLILNANNSNYVPNNPIQSQRNHTEIASNCHHHQRNKSESPAHLKLQFPSSKAFNKPKTGSRPKIKTQHSVGLGQKIINSSSVQKNFKSIKDIYLNAISNLANKSTVKSNNKLFKSENDNKNRGSKSALYDSEKKSTKNQYHSTKPQKNNQSSSALHQNYFSCISSRQNKKEDKSYNRKGTQQRLDKTLLINEVNSSQWKSVIMKVDDTFKSQHKQCKQDVANQLQNKKFKLKLKIKDSGLQKVHKSGLNTAHGKFMGQPHSYRDNTKSPKFKRYVINEDEERELNRKIQNPKYMGSVKNLNNQTYQSLLNDSIVSIKEQTTQSKRTKK